MTGLKLVGLVLIIVGALALAYGGFSYTRDRDEAEIGPITIAVEEREQVNVPLWAGLGAVVIGAGLMLVPGRRP